MVVELSDLHHPWLIRISFLEHRLPGGCIRALAAPASRRSSPQLLAFTTSDMHLQRHMRWSWHSRCWSCMLAHAGQHPGHQWRHRPSSSRPPGQHAWPVSAAKLMPSACLCTRRGGSTPPGHLSSAPSVGASSTIPLPKADCRWYAGPLTNSCATCAVQGDGLAHLREHPRHHLHS